MAAVFVPPPDAQGTVLLVRTNDGMNRYYLIIQRQPSQTFRHNRLWGPMTIPGFMFSQRFADVLWDHLRTTGANPHVHPTPTAYGTQLDISWTEGYMAPLLEAAIVEFVENALYSRILGMGAGAGAERYGGRRRRKTRSSRKRRSARSKRRSARSKRRSVRR
jgi:hypothetical protein